MTTWVFSEEVGGGPASLSLELLTKARTIGGDVAAFYVGTGSDSAWATLGAHGASVIHHLDGGDRLPAPAAAAALSELVGDGDLVMFGLTPTDRDVAGRLSARLGRPVLSNAVDIVIEGTATSVLNEMSGGATIVETAFSGTGPNIVVVRPKSFTAEPGPETTPAVIPVAVPDVGHAGSAVIVSRHEEESQGPKLSEADVIVSGGRGMGSPEGFRVVEEIAARLGAAVGATRAVVDAGCVPYSLQVGQTGKTVKPNVYLACGISGAMQHLVGMKDSGLIIAVNKDEEAPIFGIADLGVVGDVHKVLPKLLEALQARG